MSEEVVAIEAEVAPAPELEATAAPEPVVNTPEVATKTFTQEELDAAIQKRLAREQRKWERERQAPQPVAVDVPPVDQFDSVDAYAEAKAIKLIEQREQHRQQTEILEAYHEREEEARSKYDDFEQVAYNPTLKITTVMAQAIQASDAGPDVAYYLGSNPKETDRISRLSPILQAKEIGRIEAKIATDVPVKRTTSAPAPISPVTARTSGNPSYDTTDPRSVKTMTTSEWIEAERQRQTKKWQAQNR
jgi:hypothetical protein